MIDQRSIANRHLQLVEQAYLGVCRAGLIHIHTGYVLMTGSASGSALYNSMWPVQGVERAGIPLCSLLRVMALTVDTPVS